MVTYCFHSVAGYSKIMQYTGNGGSNTVNVGFQPDLVIIKNQSHSDSWYVIDSVRGNTADGSSGGTTSYLQLDDLGAAGNREAEFSGVVNFDSNGLVLNGTSVNQSSNVFLLMAFKIN